VALVKGPLFFDTTVLVGGIIDMGPAVQGAQRLMAAVARGDLGRPHTAWHCCLEFYAVSTRLPEELRISPLVALKLLEEEIFARFDVHGLPAAERLGFLAGAVRDRVAGGRIYDAHIAEIALSSKARTMVTDNRRHFASLSRHGIRVLSAEELAEDAGL